MQRLLLAMTNDEADRLEDLAAEHSATPGELVAAFVADLTCSDRSGGSDEQMYASDWLEQQTCSRWEDGKLITLREPRLL